MECSTLLYLPRMKSGLRILISVIVFMALYTSAYAQLNNSFFYMHRADTTQGLVQVYIENLNYFRNVEYTSDIDEGRTLFGYQFSPEISYQVAPGIQVSAGLFAQKDFGSDRFYELSPIYRLQYRTGAKTFRFGNLFGSMQHNLMEPLYDPERVIENRQENGFQFIWNRPNLYMDAWIDWQKMIYQNSGHPEEFTAGVIAEPKLIHTRSTSLSFPIHMLAYHRGGEIDTSHQNTSSIFNFDYATKFIHRPASGFLDSIDFQVHLAYYEDISTVQENFIDGLGQMVSAAAYFKNMGIMLNYWDSHQFQAPGGDVLYQSISFKNAKLYSHHYRKLIMARLFYEKQLAENLNFLFRATFSRDIHEKTDDVIGEFYFRWTPSWGLGKLN